MSKTIKILFVDDHQLIIQGIVSTLQELTHLEIHATTTCDEAFSMIQQHQGKHPFDILFTDLSFDNTTTLTQLHNGEALIKALQSHNIPIHIGVITGHSETNRIYSVLHNLQPSAYILKGKCSSSELQLAMDKMMTGEKYFSHEVHEKMMKRALVQIQMDDIAIQILNELPKHPKINNLEGVILKPDGTPVKIRSIENKLASLRVDLNANNNTDLVLKAKELGIID